MKKKSKFKNNAILLITISLFSLFTQCIQQKGGNLTSDQRDSITFMRNGIDTTLNIFGAEVNYNKQIHEGVNSIAYERMEVAYPNDSYTDLRAKIGELANNRKVQDDFLYALVKKSANEKTLDFFIYALCQDAQTAKKVEVYCKIKFKKVVFTNQSKTQAHYQSIPINKSGDTLPPQTKFKQTAVDTAESDEITTPSAQNNSDTLFYEIKVSRSYFHTLPNERSMKKTHLIKGDVVKIDRVQGNYYFVEYTNTKNKTSNGWLSTADLELKQVNGNN